MPRTKNDWSSIVAPKPRNDWSAVLAGEPQQPTPEQQPPQRLSFFSRFVSELPGAAYDVVSSPFRAAAAIGEEVGDIATVAPGPLRGPLSKPEDAAGYEAAKQRLADDVAPFVDPNAAVAFQQNLAKTAPGQTALRMEQGLSDIAEAGLSLASRALGSGKMSATIHRDKAQREAFLADAEKGGDMEKWIGKTGSRILNSVVRSTTKMAAGGLAGQASMYSLIGGEVFDERMASAKSRGLEGVAAVSDALDHATIETGLTFLMGQFGKRLGFESLEESLSPGVRAAAEKLSAKAVPESLRQKVGKELAGSGLEWSEENLVDLAHQGIELANGERNGIDWTQAFEAGLTGGALRMAVGGVKEIAERLRKIPAQTMQETVAGVTAAEQALGVKAPAAPTSTDGQERCGPRPGYARYWRQPRKRRSRAGSPVAGPGAARRFFETATPEMLARLSGPLSQKQFAELTGLKKTSQVFRTAFRNTLELYAQANPPTAAGPATGATVPVTPEAGEQTPTPSAPASPAPGTTVDPSTTGTPPAAPQSPTGGLNGLMERVRSLDVGQTGAAAKNWLRENFASAGLRNAEIEQANDERLGRVASDLLQAEQLRADLDRAVDAAYGGRSRLTPAQVQELDSALKGKPAAGISPEVMAAIEPMRAHVDSLSRKLLAEGVVDPDSELGLSIEANAGSYLTRTYRKFDDAKWTARVKRDAALMDRTRAWLANEYPNESPDVTEWRLNSILDRESAGARPPAGVPKSDRQFMSVLKERKALPELVRELYGEYRDPWINYTKSVAKMANLLAHKQFMADVRSAGLATGFLSDENSPRPENYRQIEAGRTPRLAELSGLYTDPITAKALQDLFSPETHSQWYRALVKASGYAKWSQTVGNSKTHVRNFVGNVAFAMSNGDLFSSPAHWAKECANDVRQSVLARRRR